MRCGVALNVLRSGIAGALLAALSFSTKSASSLVVRFAKSKFAVVTEDTFLVVSARNRASHPQSMSHLLTATFPA